MNHAELLAAIQSSEIGANPLGPPNDPERFDDFEECVEAILDPPETTREDAEEICGGWESNRRTDIARQFLTNRPGRASDPTQTKTLRERYRAESFRRFRALKGLVREAIVNRDVLGIKGGGRDVDEIDRVGGGPSAPRIVGGERTANTDRTVVGNQSPFEGPLEPPDPEAFDFPRDSDRIEAFMEWLREMERRGIIERVDNPAFGSTGATSAWQNTYIRQAYSKGLEHAKFASREMGVEVPDEALDLLFRSPRHADALGLVYTRAFEELTGVTAAMSQEIARTLASGLVEGWGAAKMASEINDRIDAIGINRARLIARTETIRAFNEAALNRYQGIGIRRVGAVVEFVTAGDDRVCPECQFLEGRTFSVDDAYGIIPVHPACRCTWLPVPP